MLLGQLGDASYAADIWIVLNHLNMKRKYPGERHKADEMQCPDQSDGIQGNNYEVIRLLTRDELDWGK